MVLYNYERTGYIAGQGGNHYQPYITNFKTKSSAHEINHEKFHVKASKDISMNDGDDQLQGTGTKLEKDAAIPSGLSS